MVHRVVYTVTIEDNEVIIDILDLLTQSSEGLRMLMQVIKDNGSKESVSVAGSVNSLKADCAVLPNTFIRLIKQNFL